MDHNSDLVVINLIENALDISFEDLRQSPPRATSTPKRLPYDVRVVDLDESSDVRAVDLDETPRDVIYVDESSAKSSIGRPDIYAPGTHVVCSKRRANIFKT